MAKFDDKIKALKQVTTMPELLALAPEVRKAATSKAKKKLAEHMIYLATEHILGK